MNTNDRLSNIWNKSFNVPEKYEFCVHCKEFKNRLYLIKKEIKMKKNQLLNIKKMIFELGRGGSKNHFFDRVNDARGTKRFFAFVQNDAGSKMCGAGARGFCAPHIWCVVTASRDSSRALRMTHKKTTFKWRGEKHVQHNYKTTKKAPKKRGFWLLAF